MRLKLSVLVFAVLTAIAVTGASSAADFDGDNGPCHETPGEPALLRCPTAHVGEPYGISIAVEKGSGCEPYDWFEVVNSALPGGLSMTRSGVISGVPSGGPGLTRFWLWLHDLTAAEGGPSWCVAGEQSEREFSIPVDPGLAIVNPSVKPATVGQPYADSLTARRLESLNPPTGPDEPATWLLQSGAPPPGVTLSAQGALTGTPTAEGSFQFVVQARSGAGVSATGAYTMVVRQPVVVKSPLGAGLRGSGEVGIRLGKTFTATGGTGNYTWALVSGALPAGVALDTARGTISGTPRTAGRFGFALTATDGEGRVATSSAALTVAQRLAIKTLHLKSAKVLQTYQARVATSGGVQPLAWRIVHGRLPVGIRLAQRLGTLAGTARRAGTFRLTAEVRDALGATSRKPLVLVVKPS
jgi:large repetitive protein